MICHKIFSTVAVLLLSTAAVSVAGDPDEGSAKKRPVNNEAYIPPDVTPEKAAKFIKWALKTLQNPQDADLEATAVAMLFGSPTLGAGFDPPRYVKKYLRERRLNYRFPLARSEAIFHFKFMLENDVPTLLGIAREGLNDPSPKVRSMAIFALGHALGFPLYKNKPHAKRSVYIDEVVDLMVTKGLTDEDEDVVHSAYCELHADRVKGTRVRLQSLDRVLAKRHVHPDFREDVQKLREKWHRAVQVGN